VNTIGTGAAPSAQAFAHHDPLGRATVGFESAESKGNLLPPVEQSEAAAAAQNRAAEQALAPTAAAPVWQAAGAPRAQPESAESRGRGTHKEGGDADTAAPGSAAALSRRLRDISGEPPRSGTLFDQRA
jgi:hypothetical protein